MIINESFGEKNGYQILSNSCWVGIHQSTLQWSTRIDCFDSTLDNLLWGQLAQGALDRVRGTGTDKSLTWGSQWLNQW
jgi:hypothetical protein